MPLDPADVRRLRMAMADLSGAVFYLGQIKGEKARRIRAALLAALDLCRRLLEE
jgi:hypothetical protein